MHYGAALALALAGHSTGEEAQVEKLADDLFKRFPDDTLVQVNCLPMIQAQLALNRTDPSKAIEALRTADPYELGTTAVHFNFIALYPIYVRGQAYLAAHRGSEAVNEFQKILDHQGVVNNGPIGVLAHLSLARAYALAGNIAKSRSAYQEFFALWEDADPDIPILKEAREEYQNMK